MRTILIISLLSVFMVFHSNAQYPATSMSNNSENGSEIVSAPMNSSVDSIVEVGQWDHLTINSDSRINKLLEIKKEESARKGGIDGYRIQIFQGSKAQADKVLAEFLRKYPECKGYRRFPRPDFTVRVGDFRTKSEAIKFKYLIEKDFPNPLIVTDVINFPDLISTKE